MKMESTRNIEELMQDRKKVCIFAGAGASIMEPTCLPSFQTLNGELMHNLYESGSKERCKSIADIHVKPEQLLQLIWDYTNDKFNPVKSFQFTQPNRNHQLIAQLVAEGVNCIVTPNFDSCIEKALASRSLPYHLFTKTPETKEEADILLHSINSNHTTIWKPHGDCQIEESLCYTRTKVAQLSNSRYLQELFSHIVRNYHLLFLGYSGYDDDFFPILYQYIPTSDKHVVWNSFKKPEEHEPCISLQKQSPNTFHIWTGDMTVLLNKLVSSTAMPARHDKNSNVDWRVYLKSQCGSIIKSKKIAILAKYLNDYDMCEDAENLWKTGLTLPESELDNDDKLRFQMNLGLITQEDAYNQAMYQNYYYIAEIALTNLITASIDESNYKLVKNYVNLYYKNCQNPVSNQFFKVGRYYNMLFIYKQSTTINDNMSLLKDDYNRAYETLLKEGDITNALFLLTKYYSIIATQNEGSSVLLEELINKSEQLLPYGDKKSLANIYYCITNMALTIGNFDIARTYHKKCFQLTELCHSMGVYKNDQYYELSAALYHQKSMILSGSQAIQASLLSLSMIEKVQNPNMKIYYKGFYYSELCHLYADINYDLAQKYGTLAIECGKRLNNLQVLARVNIYLAAADAKNNNRGKAIEKFKISYKIHKEIHENLNYLYTVLDECNINITEIKE